MSEIDKVRRDYCLDQVRRYGARRNIEMAKIWLDHAKKAAPVTLLQFHNIRMKMRDSDYVKLTGEELI